MLVVSCHRSLWLGETFNDYRDAPDARRAHALLLFVLEASLRSNSLCCFESVYDNVYAPIGIKRAVFVRLWVFLANDDRTDAFNAQAQELATVVPESDGKRGGPKRKRSYTTEVEPAMGHHLIRSVRDLAKCLVQQRLSHADETMTITFDHAGAAVDLNAFDIIEDDGDDVPVVAPDDTDPSTALVARLSAEVHFSHAISQLAAKSNRVSVADSTLSTYLQTNDDGGFTFTVAGVDRRNRLRMVDARGDGSNSWLANSSALLQFKLPHFEPTHHELSQWLRAQTAVVGIAADEVDVERLGHSDLKQHVSELMLSPALYAPIPAISAGVSSGASTWSECRYEEVYPENAAWMASCRANSAKLSRAIRTWALPPSENRYNVEQIISELRMFAAAPLNGWPAAYANVRQAVSKDILRFNEVVDGHDGFAQQTAVACMFPTVGGMPENMSKQTFYLVQFVEYMRCEFGLDRPQAHMCSVIYPWSFVLLVPHFGYPGSIQARGPPGSGKGEAKKRLQPCVNQEMWFNVDSIRYAVGCWIFF